LLNLSVNYQKQAQTNTVFVQQKEMDRVGFEPTTSANFFKVAQSSMSKGMISNNNSSTNTILRFIFLSLPDKCINALYSCLALK
jgi:hypothetical protein